MKPNLSAAIVAVLVFATPAPAAEAALSGRYLPQVVATSKPHRETLAALLKGRRGLPSWVRNMVRQGAYVAAASEALVIDGSPHELFSACQPRDCEDSQLKLVFSADGRRAVLRIADRKLGEQLLGEPSEAEKAAMMKPGL